MLPRHLLILVGFTIASLSSAVAQPGLQVDEADPLIVDWVAPQAPDGMSKDELGAVVVVEFVIDETGVVTDAKAQSEADPRLQDAAEATVRLWTFEPAISGGKRVPCAVRVPVRFGRNAGEARSLKPVSPQVLPRTSPSVKRWGRIDDPVTRFARHLGGNVVMEFTVTPDGRGEHPRVIAASSADLVRPALDGLGRTTFEPAKQGTLLKVPATLQAPFEFSAQTEDRAVQLEAVGMSPTGGYSWEGMTLLPAALTYCEPVYPYDALVSGIAGDAEVQFTVNTAGYVSNVAVTTASAPEFGAALEAAVRGWVFRAAQKPDGKVDVRLAWNHHFEPPTGESNTAGRLLTLVRPGGAGVGSARGLDGKIVPRFRVAPVLGDSANQPGDAVVEFIIDRDGRARLPRVTKASSDAFGWAAATAVAQWIFEPPTRSGEPVDVRVAIPITHKP